MGLGELGAQAADEGQLAIVVGEQLVAHRPVPLTSTLPVAGCNAESNTTGSGAGSACSMASMRNRSVRSSGSALPSISTLTSGNRGSKSRIDRLEDPAKLLAPCGRAQVRARQVGNPVVHQRHFQLARGSPASDWHRRRRVQQVLQVAAHALLQLAQHLAARLGRLARRGRVVVDQAVEHRRHQRLISFDFRHLSLVRRRKW